MKALPEGIRKNKEAVAEVIENNVRKLIIDEQPINPKYYEKMSELLDALIKQRRQGGIGLSGVSGEDRRTDEEGEEPGSGRDLSRRRSIRPASVRSTTTSEMMRRWRWPFMMLCVAAGKTIGGTIPSRSRK